MKRILVMLCILFVLLPLCSCKFGKDKDTPSDIWNNLYFDSFYVSDELGEAIYKATQDESFDYYLFLKSKNIHIVKETIAPVYTFDMIEYANSGTYSVEHMSLPNGNVYVAKVVEFGTSQYMGNMIFSIKDGIANGLQFTPSRLLADEFDNSSFDMSMSYADHAQRIKKMLDKDTVISPENVKFLWIDVGYFFYVNVDQTEYFIPVGRYYTGINEVETDLILKKSEIEDLAKVVLDIDYKNSQNEPDTAGMIFPPFISCHVSPLDNIINVSKFFEMTSQTFNGRMTLDEVKEIISESGSAHDAVTFIDLRQPVADYVGGINIIRAYYWLDDMGDECILVYPKSSTIWYIDKNDESKSVLLRKPINILLEIKEFFERN